MRGKKAFSLLELSIVIAISAVILATTTTGYFAYSKNVGRQANVLKLQNIQKAVEIYFAKNGYLPCPADPALTLSNPLFGSERLDDTGTGCSGDPSHNAGGAVSGNSTCSSNGSSSGNCDYSANNGSSSNGGHPIPFQNQSRSSLGTVGQYFLFGSIPTATLGLKNTDGIDSYGNKITYVVLDSIANYKRHSDTFYQNLYGYGNTNIHQSSDVSNGSGNSNLLFYNSSSCAVNGFIGLFGNISLSSSSQDNNRLVANACNAQVMNVLSNSVVSASQNNLAFVLISYGHTGRGAWNTSGTINASSTSTMEKSNSYSFYVASSGIAYNTNNYVFDNTGSTSKPLKFYQGANGNLFDNWVVWDTIPQLISNTNANNAIYCMASTHPGLPLSTIPSTTTFNLTQNGTSYTLGGITKTCSGMGTWI